MAEPTLKVEKRKILGRKVKKLREKGILPANIFGKKTDSVAIKVKLTDFQNTYRKAGETGIVSLVIGKKKRPVLIHDVQADPVTDLPIHADFLQIDLKEKVTAQVPVELVGESPAETEGDGTVVQQIDEVEVEALPRNLPDKFELDISQLKEIDSFLSVADIKTDSNKIKIGNDPEQIIVKVEPPPEEEELAIPVTPESEAEEPEGAEEKVEKEEGEREEKESSEEKGKGFEKQESPKDKKSH